MHYSLSKQVKLIIFALEDQQDLYLDSKIAFKNTIVQFTTALNPVPINHNNQGTDLICPQGGFGPTRGGVM